MRSIPIRLRVAAAFAIAMTVVLVLFGFFLHARLASDLSESLDRALRLRVTALVPLVRHSDVSLAASSGAPFIESGESYAELVDSRGRVLDSTASLEGALLLRSGQIEKALERTIFATMGHVPGLDEDSRVLATPVVRRGQRLVLIVGATLEDRAEALEALRNELLIVIPVAIALATLAGYALAGVGLRSVESMRRRAATISAETPGQRLPVPGTRDEIERLGVTLNEMLARLEDALERERAFVADAGHELRTPLAFLRTELELALRPGRTLAELRDAVRVASAETDRLGQLADDLLLLARVEGGSLPLRREVLDVDGLLGNMATRFAWRAEAAERKLVVEPFGGSIQADRLRLEQAIGNMVDNALRHGAGPVILSAVATDDAVEIHVRDEGRGFPEGFLENAFERFSRGHPGRTGGGAGLGLAIARVIAVAHGGSASARTTPAGADVWVSIPAPRE